MFQLMDNTYNVCYHKHIFNEREYGILKYQQDHATFI